MKKLSDAITKAMVIIYSVVKFSVKLPEISGNKN